MEGGAEVQHVHFTPDKELQFEVVGGSQCMQSLVLENIQDTFVAFKIKTTAPRSYLVKPSSGIIAPRAKQDINILLIPLFEPPKEPRADRFLVQTTTVNQNQPLSKEEWAEISSKKENLAEKRLSVNLRWMGSSSEQSGMDVSSILAKPIPEDYKALRSMYEELVTFVIALEKQKRELETELDETRRSGQANLDRSAAQRLSKGAATLELWQVIVLLIVIIAILKSISFF